ncbi:MAG: potassium channel family protein [Bacteroidota bacterium]
MSVMKLTIAVFSIVSIGLLTFSFFLDQNSELYRLLNYYDWGLCIFFLYDFFDELFRAKNKTKYFFTVGWLDLLSSVPMIHELRFARIVRVIRIVRIFHTARFMVEYVRSNGRSTMYAVVVIILVTMIILSSFLVLMVEKDVGNIKTAEDALWWTFISVSTVGYGDYYPVTDVGRIFASLLIMSGIVGFGTIVSYLSGKFNSFKDHNE